MRTQRLLLREWRDDDRTPFAALNADPRVMEHMPQLLSRADSDAFVDRIRAHFDTHGYGLFALEAAGAFIGFVGLQHVPFDAHFTPAVEIGWRLAHDAWGNGYASEAAREVLRYGFADQKLSEIVSITIAANQRSWHVMERLGMTRRSEDDFDHPRLADRHPLRRHVLYRIRALDSGR
jgi:ribosomal-protein-alanine N-acetyltransferase